MTRSRRSLPGILALAIGHFALAACDGSVTAVQINRPGGAQDDGQEGLLTCVADEPSSVTTEIGPEGGLVALDGHRLFVPAGALVRTVPVTLDVPAGQNLELRFTVDGENVFAFLRDVVVEISYARCLEAVGEAPLAVWVLDPITRIPVLDLGGVDDPERMTIAAATDVISTFAVAR